MNYILLNNVIFNQTDITDYKELTNGNALTDKFLNTEYNYYTKADYEGIINEICDFLKSKQQSSLIISTFYYKLPCFIDVLQAIFIENKSEPEKIKIIPLFEFLCNVPENNEISTFNELYDRFIISSTFNFANNAIEIIYQEIKRRIEGDDIPTNTKTEIYCNFRKISSNCCNRANPNNYKLAQANYEIQSLSEMRDSFNTEYSAWVLDECNNLQGISFKRNTHLNSKYNMLKVPCKLFEDTRFRIGNCEAFKYFLHIKSDFFNNLYANIKGIDNKEFFSLLEFNYIDSIIDLINNRYLIRSLISNKSLCDGFLTKLIEKGKENHADDKTKESYKAHIVENLRIFIGLQDRGEFSNGYNGIINNKSSFEEELKKFDAIIKDIISQREELSIYELEKRRNS
jgi:hypothetical protein